MGFRKATNISSEQVCTLEYLITCVIAAAFYRFSKD
jgi:hypothetical protein